MSDRTLAEILEEHGLTPELLQGPVMSRGAFIKTMAGGIAVLLVAPVSRAGGSPAPAGEPPALLTAGRQPLPPTRESPREIVGWLYIGADGQVTAYAGKVELGQNVRTSLTQVVAEELLLPATAIKLVLGDTDFTPFDAGTFGSRTIPGTVPPLRNAAAAARELLLDLAAEQLQAARARLVIANGKVSDPATKRSLGYGELTKGQELVQAIPAEVPVIPPARWKVVGQPIPKPDAVDTVTGRKKFASDFKRPGMLHARVLRSKALRDTLKSADTRKAEAMPGVLVHREQGFVAVVAPTEALTDKALATITAQWDHTPQLHAADLYDHLRKTARPAGDRGGVVKGSVADGMAGADRTLKQTYTTSYVAHAAMEPRCGVAEWEGDRLTVWAATQSPFGVRRALADTFGIPETRVRVIGLDTAVGYGGKTPCPPAIEAARIARAIKRPVRVAWNRQEEMSLPHYRPAGIIDISSGVKRDGTLLAWEYHNYNSGPAALGTPYNVANQLVQFHACDGPLPQGAYRALAAPVNFWARETHMDELANALGMDPVLFRLKNAVEPRLRAVIKTAAERFGWRGKPAPGRGFGIAAGTEKGSWVATCAEVTVKDGQVKVERLVSAFECGAIINPLHLHNQAEGGAAMALGAALFEALEFDDGEILNPLWSSYRLPRFSDMPKIEIHLLDRRDLQSVGGGETPCCAVSAAVGNAIFSATGVRLRSLPLVPNGMPK